MERTQAIQAGSFNVVGYGQLSPYKWLEAIHDHVGMGAKSSEEWKGISDAISTFFLRYLDAKKTTDRSDVEGFMHSVESLSGTVHDVQPLQTQLMRIANKDYPELTMIRYGNFIREYLLLSIEEVTPRVLKKLEVGCMLISTDMGFTEAQTGHAKALLEQIQDTSEGQLARINAALATLREDFSQGIGFQKGVNYMCSSLFGWN